MTFNFLREILFIHPDVPMSFIILFNYCTGLLNATCLHTSHYPVFSCPCHILIGMEQKITSSFKTSLRWDRIWKNGHMYFTDPILLIWKFIKNTGIGSYTDMIFWSMIKEQQLIANSYEIHIYLLFLYRRFYESPKLKIRIHELCMLLQFQSQLCA